MKITIENKEPAPRRIKARDLQAGQVGKVTACCVSSFVGHLWLCCGSARQVVDLTDPVSGWDRAANFDASTEVELLEGKQIILHV